MTSRLEPEAAKEGGWTPKPPSGAVSDGGITYGHQRIFVKRVQGAFQRLRWVTFSFFLAVFAILPWLPWGDRRAVLFDVARQKFHLFNAIIWPQEFYLLTLVLLLGAVSLFFLTTLVGRLWCGYLCPQTVVTNLFMTVERWIEGDRVHQQRLAKAPWHAEKIAKAALKNALWTVMAAGFGFTFTSYFVPQASLWADLSSLQINGFTGLMLAVTAFTLFDGGYFREQMCLVPCPYGRFQGVLIDQHSLLVAYDAGRGEPRGRTTAADSSGDCVDCTLCVQVCPTGIDIRQGSQYECIDCAACVDACDRVMAKIGRPEGLIRYTSQAALDGLPPVRRVRPWLYGTALAVLVGTLGVLLATRTETALDVIRDRQALYRMLPDGRVSNAYRLKILNKDDKAHRYRISFAGLDGELAAGTNPLSVPAGTVVSQQVSVVTAGTQPPGSQAIVFRLETVDGQDEAPVSTKSTFFVPAAGLTR